MQVAWARTSSTSSPAVGGRVGDLEGLVDDVDALVEAAVDHEVLRERGQDPGAAGRWRRRDHAQGTLHGLDGATEVAGVPLVATQLLVHLTEHDAGGRIARSARGGGLACRSRLDGATHQRDGSAEGAGGGGGASGAGQEGGLAAAVGGVDAGQLQRGFVVEQHGLGRIEAGGPDSGALVGLTRLRGAGGARPVPGRECRLVGESLGDGRVQGLALRRQGQRLHGLCAQLVRDGQALPVLDDEAGGSSLLEALDGQASVWWMRLQERGRQQGHSGGGQDAHGTGRFSR